MIATRVVVTATSASWPSLDCLTPGVPKYADLVRRKIAGAWFSEGQSFEWDVCGIRVHVKVDSIHGEGQGPWKVDRKRTQIDVKDAKPDVVMDTDEYDADLETNVTNIIQSAFLDASKFRQLNLPAAKSLLIHGVFGVGKKTLVRQVCNRLQCRVYKVSLYDILSLKDEFENPQFQLYNPLHLSTSQAIKTQPCIILLTDLDVLYSGCESSHKDKILNVISQEIERLNEDDHVCFIGLAEELRRLPNRLQKTDCFRQHLHIPIPSLHQRKAILRNLLHKMELQRDNTEGKQQNQQETIVEDYAIHIALRTSGFVARDLRLLCRKAKLKAQRRKESAESDVVSKLASLSISNDEASAISSVTWADFEYALSIHSPSQRLEVETKLPKRNWEDIGGYEFVKKRIKQATLVPLLNPEQFSRLGIKPPSGILLYGPSGCGKTAMVQALASESIMNIISIKGPEIFSKYLGETERKIRSLFATAKRIAPCIVFLDEIDAIGTRRGWDSGDSSGGVNERVLSTLLNEMDGVEGRQGVVVIGCTNRPDQIDDAILRPGRLDQLLYVGLPSEQDRASIIQAFTQKMAIDPDVNSTYLSQKLEYCTGADIEHLFREAATIALREDINTPYIKMKHINPVLDATCSRAQERLQDKDYLGVFERFQQAHSV
ncbi:hypothetical protein VTP01DRAFT_9554 [Rhizomucor pusillus]|uniref:uncharacterized protein n=1 Tax=Rhizomucor pusillus TaxID=4840 RepID=UPI0037438886